jgi:DNA-binding transcriptional MerR regulator
MADTSFAIADLRSRWYTLNDLDRAQAIKVIHQSGVSLRKLAPFLNCSPSLLSHLLQAGQAPLEDRVLARRGELSTRALVRSAKATGVRCTTLHREAIAFERESEARRHSQAIERWFGEQGVADADRGQVIERACLHLSPPEWTERLPLVAIPAGMSADNSVRTCLPTQPDPTEVGFAAGIAWQLAHWVAAGISDHQLRQRALELAGDALTGWQGPAL